MSVTLDEAIEATAARAVLREALPPLVRPCTDTRTLRPGDTFVALRGERYDGHAFCAEAHARGAAAFIVEEESALPPDAPGFVVPATRAAYLAIAATVRRRSHARVVAVTGSAGKTTTTAFIAQLLARLYPSASIVATPGNENNEIGVAHLLLCVAPQTRFAVVELGARHYGEIAPLARAAHPEVAVVTNIGDAHLEIFETRERLAETKFGIFATGASPVLASNDGVSVRRAASLARPITWFAASGEARRGGTLDADRAVHLLRTSEGDALAVVGAESGMYRTMIDVPGEHNRENVAAAAAAAVALGAKAVDVARALSALHLPPGRYERIEAGHFELIYDAYNASASGTIATLASFASERARRRIAVLGSMAELGPEAATLHERTGAAAARAHLDRLLVGGDHADDVARGARAAGMPPSNIVFYRDNADVVAWLRANALPGDLVLLKASRRYKLEEVVEGLRGAPAG